MHCQHISMLTVLLSVIGRVSCPLLAQSGLSDLIAFCMHKLSVGVWTNKHDYWISNADNFSSSSSTRLISTFTAASESIVITLLSSCRRSSFTLSPLHMYGRVNKITFNTWWNNAKKQAAVKLGRPVPGTFHDIKAKAISDYEGSSRDKQLFSGHKTELQVTTYDRKVKVTPSLDFPPLDKPD